MYTSQSTRKGKRDELNTSEWYKYFKQESCTQIFAKQYLKLYNISFTMKEASFNIAMLSLFLGMVNIFIPQKISPGQKRFHLFCTFAVIWANLLLQRHSFLLWKSLLNANLSIFLAVHRQLNRWPCLSVCASDIDEMPNLTFETRSRFCFLQSRAENEILFT